MSLTVVQRVDGVDHQLQEAVPEVAPGVEDLEWDSSRFVLLVASVKCTHGDSRPPSAPPLSGHHPGHGRARHARLHGEKKRC